MVENNVKPNGMGILQRSGRYPWGSDKQKEEMAKNMNADIPKDERNSFAKEEIDKNKNG